MRDFLRRVGLPSLIDATPATLRPQVHMTPAAWLLLVAGRPLWAWRVELATFLLVVAVLRWLAGHLGLVLAVLLVAFLASLAALVPEVRRSVWLLYRRAHVRRQWTLAVRHAGLANFNDRVPRVVGHRLAGDDVAVRVPAGKTVSEVEDKAETIAAFLRVREVRVHRRPEDAGLAQVMVVVRDPLGSSERWPWPNLPPSGCRCGSRSRSAWTRTASWSCSRWSSATSSTAASPARARASPNRWGPRPPPSTRT